MPQRFIVNNRREIRLGLELRRRIACDPRAEETPLAIAKPACVGRQVPEQNQLVGDEPGFLAQFFARSLLGSFAGIDVAARQFQRELFDSSPELSNQWKRSVFCYGKNGDVVECTNRVMQSRVVAHALSN